MADHEKAGMRYEVEVKEEFFGYSPDDYARWGVDRAYVEACVGRTGTLGCDLSRYLEQSPRQKGYQHFPEIHIARHLMESEGIRPDCILYENYYLSASALRAAGPNGKKVIGTRLLERALSPRFFELFDKLYARNPALQALAASSLHLDLFVLDEARKSAAFWEVKKISPDKHVHEGIAPHQAACLAAFSYLFQTRRDEILLSPGWTPSVRLAVLVPDVALRTHRFAPKTHRTTIMV